MAQYEAACAARDDRPSDAMVDAVTPAAARVKFEQSNAKLAAAMRGAMRQMAEGKL